MSPHPTHPPVVMCDGAELDNKLMVTKIYISGHDRSLICENISGDNYIKQNPILVVSRTEGHAVLAEDMLSMCSFFKSTNSWLIINGGFLDRQCKDMSGTGSGG